MLVKKLGHPVPLSNFISEVKSGSLQQAQTKTPARFSSFKGLENGRSVASLRRTKNCWPGSASFHSASAFWIGAVDVATLASLASRFFQFCWIIATEALVFAAARACPALAPTSDNAANA